MPKHRNLIYPASDPLSKREPSQREIDAYERGADRAYYRSLDMEAEALKEDPGLREAFRHGWRSQFINYADDS